MRIEGADVSVYHVPLQRPWGDTTHAITHIDLLLLDLRTDGGVVGTGYTYSVGVGLKAVEALLRWDVVPKLIGLPVNPRGTWHDLWRVLHDTGGGGTSTLALAAVDIALWDILGKAAGAPLVQLLGQMRPSISAYGSGVNLNLSLDALKEQVRRWLARGYPAVKVKVGRPDIAEDIERLQAVRALIGNRPLLVDANQGWDLPTAVERITAYEPLGLHWIEEPLLSDDIAGHAVLRRRVRTPIAIGENIYNRYQVAAYLRRSACDYLQADVMRVGGITPWMAIAAQAEAESIPMAPHFMLEITGQLLCCISNAHILEDVEGGSLTDLGVLRRPMPVTDGRFVPPSAPGHGIDFDREALARHRWTEAGMGGSAGH